MKNVRIYLGYYLNNNSPSDWVLKCLRNWRKNAGIPDHQVYDYPELEEYEGIFKIPNIYDEDPSAYIEMPEDKFLIFKLKYCK